MKHKLKDLNEWYDGGEVFAYPTEAVFGLGCDPQNKQAVYSILSMKRRRVEKGLILIASDFSQIKPYVLFDNLPLVSQQTILDSWPGPVTWLLPKSAYTPPWISGDSELVAVRISAHPQVQEICRFLKKPIVSTSANPVGQAPALNSKELKAYFGEQLRIIEGDLGSERSPSKILNSVNMETIRA